MDIKLTRFRFIGWSRTILCDFSLAWELHISKVQKLLLQRIPHCIILSTYIKMIACTEDFLIIIMNAKRTTNYSKNNVNWAQFRWTEKEIRRTTSATRSDTTYCNVTAIIKYKQSFRRCVGIIVDTPDVMPNLKLSDFTFWVNVSASSSLSFHISGSIKQVLVNVRLFVLVCSLYVYPPLWAVKKWNKYKHSKIITVTFCGTRFRKLFTNWERQTSHPIRKCHNICFNLWFTLLKDFYRKVLLIRWHC